MARFWQYLFSLVLIASVTAMFFALCEVLDTTLVAFTFPLIWDGVISHQSPMDTETE